MYRLLWQRLGALTLPGASSASRWEPMRRSATLGATHRSLVLNPRRVFASESMGSLHMQYAQEHECDATDRSSLGRRGELCHTHFLGASGQSAASAASGGDVRTDAGDVQEALSALSAVQFEAVLVRIVRYSVDRRRFATVRRHCMSDRKTLFFW